MFAPLSWQNKYRLEKILITSLNVGCKFIYTSIIIHENDKNTYMVCNIKNVYPSKIIFELKFTFTHAVQPFSVISLSALRGMYSYLLLETQTALCNI